MEVYEEAVAFERKVASIFRTLGADVQHNVSLAGNQIDILVTEKTATGASVRTAVECKYFRKLVGLHTVNAFAGLVALLKDRELIHKAALVAKSGFTQQARLAPQAHMID